MLSSFLDSALSIRKVIKSIEYFAKMMYLCTKINAFDVFKEERIDNGK